MKTGVRCSELKSPEEAEVQAVAHTFSPSPQEAEAGVGVQPGLHSQFLASQGYLERPSLKIKQKAGLA